MTDTGIAGGLRETIRQAQDSAEMQADLGDGREAFIELNAAVYSALAQLEALELDYEAMWRALEKLQDEHTYTSNWRSRPLGWCTMCNPSDPLPAHEPECPFAILGKKETENDV